MQRWLHRMDHRRHLAVRQHDVRGRDLQRQEQALVASRPSPLYELDLDPTGARPERQAQRRRRSILCRDQRPHHEEQGLAGLGGQAESAQVFVPDLVRPEQQGTGRAAANDGVKSDIRTRPQR